MIEIEKNVPVPDDAGGHGMKSKYPWAGMKVGESFFVPSLISTSQIPFPQKYIQMGWKFCRRTVDGGVRVWRIE